MLRLKSVTVTLLGLAGLLAAAAPPAVAQTRLLRFPDIHDRQVVFCHAGDLWLASVDGGVARRLTAHPGLELFPRFSPDGSMIAFTGQYDGDEQVYVVPTSGGIPRQLTHYPARGPLPPRWGYDNQVYGWTNDGKSVLFRSLRESWQVAESRLFTAPLDGGMPQALPMPVSGAGDLSPDGRRVVYAPLARDFRTWKRYQGGWAQDLYLFDLTSHEAVQITDDPRTDRDPMWIGDRIYFASDRDGKLNLFVYDIASRRTQQLTHSDVWDVRWPSSDNRGQIVYELNGELQVFRIESGQSQRIAIDVPNDGVAMRPSRVSAGGQIEDLELSPKGERALFVARGDVFSLPIEKGYARNLTNTSRHHDKWARWSPDGRQIAFISDRSGEDEVWLVAQDGLTPAEQLTRDGQAMRYAAEWSPDGKRLAFSDKGGRLTVLEIAGGKSTLVADEARGQVRDYTWSPDGAHLAFSLSDPHDFRSIYLWSVGDREPRRVTGPFFNEYGPAWDPEGRYLYYLSDREFAPQLSGLEWNFATNRTTEIHVLALRKDVPHPFPPQSDEVNSEDAEAKDDDASESDKEQSDKSTKDAAGKGSKKPKKLEPVKIDFEGLGQRVTRVPVPAENYGGLTAVKGHLLYVRRAPAYYGRETERRPDLRIFSLEKREDRALVENVDGFAASRDGSKVLVRNGAEVKLYEVKFDGKDAGKAVSTAGLVVDRVPAEEWAEIFDEVWRRFRDFFYVDNMHGYDWEALQRQYRPLLEHVAHRSDLNYLIGEMISELNAGHAYIAGGDWYAPPRPQVALPGARFELDTVAGRYRIAQILRGQNEEARYRSPLTEVGVDAREGDYVLAVDGVELRADDSPYRLLRNKADRPVQLTLHDKPTLDGARKVSFVPITTEEDLLYLDWIEENRRRVSELSDGRVGYLHIPDMGADGIREFIKWFYGQIRLEGLIVDVRGNGGGNVSQMVIERLGRKLLGTRFARNNETPGTYPNAVFHGHMACLLDENSASDGDIFPHMFRKAGLGPLIGKRSWGGVVGITNRGPLIDGGTVNVPEFGTNEVDGRWVIEGHGVDPDIVVENDPKQLLAGRDAQLERGVAEVLRRIREEPRRLPARPAPPIKTH